MKTKKASPSDQARRTPPWLFKLLEQELNVKFILDASASPDNALCRRYYALERGQDGLTLPWTERRRGVKVDEATFCNPGFKHFGWWMKKAYDEYCARGTTSILIGPTGCSQTWFHNFAQLGTVYVPDQRIIFYASDGSGPTHGADRDTMIYCFGRRFSHGAANGFQMYALPVKGLVVYSRRKK